MPVAVGCGFSGEQESESEAASVIEVREETIPHQPTTRSGRLIKKNLGFNREIQLLFIR